MANTFYILTSEKVKIDGNGKLTFASFISGTAMKNDKVAIFLDNGEIEYDSIITLKVNGEEKDEISNQYVTISLENAKRKTEIDRYTVISNVLPVGRNTENKPVTNPILRTLTLSALDLKEDSDFVRKINFAFCHTDYIVPVMIDNNDIKDKDVTQNTQIKFLNLANKEGQKYLPIFTDVETLFMWSEFKNGNLKQTLTMNLEEILRVINTNNIGVVINPFGPQTLNLENVAANDLVKNVLHPENNIKESKISDGTQLRLKNPVETVEYNMLKNKLVEIAKDETDIEKMYLIVMIDQESGNESYLCVLDTPNINLKDLVQRMGNNLSGMKLTEIKTINFMPFATINLENTPAKPIYVK